MSANTIISEGGKGYSFGPVKALMVEGDNGDFYPWYPEADRALGSLSVDKNGVYRASDRGAYGWNRVSVNVAQSDSVTGRDPDTGEEKSVTVNPETGELVEKVVPVEIRVIEPPTNPYGVYVDGQTITKDGMVVKAYGANGDEMQTVPVGEITINPTVAFFDESKDRPGGEKVIATPLDIGGANIFINKGVPLIYYTPLSGPSSSTSPFSFGFPDSVVYTLDAWHDSVSSISYYMIVASHTISQYVQNTYTHDGKTVYYSIFDTRMSEANSSVDGTNAPLSGYDKSKGVAMAWSMIYGDIEEIPAGAPQTITVSWPRPGDGAILETNFDILVGPRGGQGDD